MKIWVDADACPKVIKEILFRTADREKVNVTLVANQYIAIPASPYIDFVQVESGFDIADDKIVELCAHCDLVITADIPLAAAIVKCGAFALNPRGELYTAENIGPILTMRNITDSMRSGLSDLTGGPAPFKHKDREAFANQLDKFLARTRKGQA
jgi:uncharacterized protein YaiI (UPF0178 family)